MLARAGSELRQRPHRAAVVLAALVVACAFLLPVARASFSSSTTNPANSAGAGNVVISDDDGGAAMITVGTLGSGQVDGSGLRPGSSVSNCVRVTYTGSLPAEVRLYLAARSDTAPNGTTLSSNLHVSVAEATSGAFGCTGYSGASPLWDTTHPANQPDLVTSFPTDYPSAVQTGLVSWATNATRTYRFTFTLDPAVPDTATSAAANLTFRWEARNSPVSLAANRPATGSTPCAATEGADKAFNGSYTGGLGDKFCSLDATPFLQTDLGRPVSISRFVIRHSGAGGESAAGNTRAYQIQLSSDGSTWTTVVTVTANTANSTTDTITPTTARYAKLIVNTPIQPGSPMSNAARIYEFEIYSS